MKVIEFEGEKYLIRDDGSITDMIGIDVSKDIFLKITSNQFSLDDYKNKSSKELIESIKFYKTHEIFSLAQTLILFGLNKFNNDFLYIRTVLPILTSCYRKIHQPEEAIKIVKQYANEITKSPALYVSAAAAYCDMGDYINARKCANVAYAQLADLSDEYKMEIRNVYRRIEAETK